MSDKDKHLCPVCGKFMFESAKSYDICDVCGWEDDFYQEENPECDTGANDCSLNEYREKYNNGWKPNWL